MRVEKRNLAEFTTLGVGGPAEVWTVENEGDLAKAVSKPFRILGNGSNLLVSDKGVSERVIRLGGVFAQGDLGSVRGDPHLTPWIGAGVLLPSLVQEALNKGLSGLEPLLGIPASIGGAVRMNAGTRFGAIADVLEAVEIFHDGAFVVCAPEELSFAYRQSRLPAGAVISRVRLRLRKKSQDEIASLLARVDSARKGQPKRKSAGCAFKNPPGDSAGRLIDAAGLKGLSRGKAEISLEHANFFINRGGAKAKDFWELVTAVREQLPLELEWEIWGELS